MKLELTISLITQIITAVSLLSAMIVSLTKVFQGSKCLLRSEMLRIYYNNKDARKIRQYEYENFVYLYEAYKKLRGNSFIDKIYVDLQEWEVVS